MIRLRTETLSKASAAQLTSMQLALDGALRRKGLPDWAGEIRARWNSKSGSKTAKATFDEVKATLLGMCVGTEVCNYCENNEATDIEHIYPKSFFPERTFQWDNYLLACGTCNTHYKLDKFSIFDPAGSANVRPLRRGECPPQSDVAFIDPRTENPLTYLKLVIRKDDFALEPNPDLHDARGVAKALATLDVLEIGVRPTLRDARERAIQYFQDRLDRYIRAKAATTHAELAAIVQDPRVVDTSVPFADEQQALLTGYHNDIITYPHPTVWQEMIRQRAQLPKTNRLFTAEPDALNW